MSAAAATGDVYVWGSDRLEQLGLGPGVRQRSGMKQLAPRVVKGLRTRTVVEASCGYAHTLVLAGASAWRERSSSF
jgi:alpha-tubulin suppressor-like RCC1 family protein